MTIRDAFLMAAQGQSWVLKGRGHVERVALKPHISRMAAEVTKEGLHWEMVYPGKNCGPRRLFALELVLNAADLAGVDYENLVSK